ncbi:hypothetical protein PAPYR_6607 [Paratrimastix pyriformis]|uniref:Uncharacterized protein n=1 Tax=Paratrimastix pyriformis TaxID=342808 RepID=A0ABQ8UET5_9EUKA|nr:hypothetical protein PAPYR_6607 [Paratrimastix pyriformis]
MASLSLSDDLNISSTREYSGMFLLYHNSVQALLGPQEIRPYGDGRDTTPVRTDYGAEIFGFAQFPRPHKGMAFLSFSSAAAARDFTKQHGVGSGTSTGRQRDHPEGVILYHVPSDWDADSIRRAMGNPGGVEIVLPPGPCVAIPADYEARFRVEMTPLLAPFRGKVKFVKVQAGKSPAILLSFPTPALAESAQQALANRVIYGGTLSNLHCEFSWVGDHVDIATIRKKSHGDGVPPSPHVCAAQFRLSLAHRDALEGLLKAAVPSLIPLPPSTYDRGHAAFRVRESSLAALTASHQAVYNVMRGTPYPLESAAEALLLFGRCGQAQLDVIQTECRCAIESFPDRQVITMAGSPEAIAATTTRIKEWAQHCHVVTLPLPGASLKVMLGQKSSARLIAQFPGVELLDVNLRRRSADVSGPPDAIERLRGALTAMKRPPIGADGR